MRSGSCWRQRPIVAVAVVVVDAMVADARRLTSSTSASARLMLP